MAVDRRACLIAVIVLVAGCGTASTSDLAWSYIGTDPTLGNAPTDFSPELRRRIAAERASHPGVPSPTLQARQQMDFPAWQQRVREAMEEDKSACRQQTGDSGLRHWTGYDEAFLACMKTRGWTRATGTDPL